MKIDRKSLLAEIRERAQKASPGPWKRGVTLPTNRTKQWSKEKVRLNDLIESRHVFANFHFQDEGKSREQVAECSAYFNGFSNAEFIAHAREDIPYLLDLVDRLQMELEKKGKRP
jgi:hypothetical protein